MMRMGTFLLGGIAGAAAVVYLARNRNNWMLSTLLNASSTGRALDKAANAVNKAASQSASSHNRSDEGLGRVKSIVKEDPAIKRQVNEILASSTYDKETTNATV